MNAYRDSYWGLSKTFNPVAFDADAMMRLAKDAGFRYVIPTAKHHDGFMLFPTPFTNHSVLSSSWEGGKGDVVAAFAASCRALGLRPSAHSKGAR